MADQSPTRSYTDEQLKSDAVSKKDIIKFLQENATFEFLKEMKLNGKLNNIAKTSKKDHLIDAYNSCFEQKAFKKGDEATMEEQLQMNELCKKTAAVELAKEKKAAAKKEEASHVKEEPKYKKIVLKQGDRTSFPAKHEKVSCLYTGKLEDGTVFDTNCADNAKKNKKGEIKPLIFPVGTGRVIRGWDEALLTMSLGEKAEIHIEHEWAYGRKGLPDSGYVCYTISSPEPEFLLISTEEQEERRLWEQDWIPPFAKLIFEVELVNIAD